MTKLAVLSVEGESELWLVDFKAGTVSAMPSIIANGEDDLTRINGKAVIRGLDIAVAIDVKDPGFSSRYWQSA